MSFIPADSARIIPDNFVEIVEDYIQQHPLGFKEYDLIQCLNNENIFETKEVKKSASLQIFQKHFLVFHVLYLINEKMMAAKTGSLKISTLLIQKLDYIDTKTEVGEFDPLHDYYIDLNNMKKATEETVDGLLTSFWEQFLTNDQRKEALETLGLCDPIDDQEIKSNYHRLANTHHPDKGGDSEKILEINKAYAALIKI